jgi:predicted ArsR family transcriptional regulator
MTIDLSPAPLARATDPHTSFMAAAAAEAGAMAANHRARVLAVLKEAGKPLGAEQIADAIGLDAYQTRKRLPELQEQRLVALAEGQRMTRTGRAERLWVAA